MKYKCLECREEFMQAATITSDVPATQDIINFYVCPFCRSRHYDELKLEEARITNVKSVPVEEVDDWIVKGYEVEALYQKSANLIKREQKKTITVAYLEEVKKEES